MKTRLLGLASSLRAAVAGNVSGPGGLKRSGTADACRRWTSALSNETTSASASLARRTAIFINTVSLSSDREYGSIEPFLVIAPGTIREQKSLPPLALQRHHEAIPSCPLRRLKR